MNDNDIIKALECCKDAECMNCPRWTEEWYSGQCNSFLQDVLDLIKRKNAEILELQGDLKLVRGTNKRLLDLCDEKDAEIKRLLETIDKQQATIDKKQAEIDAFSKEMKGEHHETVEDRADL